MLIWLGGFGGRLQTLPGVSSPPWRLYLSLNAVIDPGPTQTLLFWDMREDSTSFGNFFVDMTGFPDKPAITQIWDFPASYHNKAGGLSFVDGHAEIKRWRDLRTMPPVRKDSNWMFTRGTVVQPHNKDVVWLQERATRKIQ